MNPARYAYFFIVLAIVALTFQASSVIGSKPDRVTQASTDTNLLYISPSNITNQAANTQFTVSIEVANMQKIIGWDVFVQVSDPNVIVPTNVSFANDVFEANYSATLELIASCINNVGLGCRTGDGNGVAHSAGIVFGPTNPPIAGPLSGMLFVITFNVTASFGYSQIEILTSYSSLPDGTVTPVPYTTENGVYGIPTGPDFSVSVDPGALSVIQGSNITTTVTVISLVGNTGVGFGGIINLTATQELPSVFGNRTLNVPMGGSVSTRLTLITSEANVYSYSMTIFASNATVTHNAPLSVNVEFPAGFSLSINPGLIRIHGGNSANSTVTVTSEQGFHGNVHLNLTIFTCTQACSVLNRTLTPGLSASFGTQDMVLTPKSSESTIINVTTPASSLSFIYRIDVLATSGSIYASPQSLLVTPPISSLSVSPNPSSLTIGAGNSTAMSVNVQSVDYFWGWVYVSAVMNGGRASFDKPSYHIALPTSAQQLYAPSANFTLTIKVFTGAIPGSYVLLLTVYSVETTPITLPNSFKISGVVPLTLQVAIPLQITDPSLYRVSLPAVFGLAPIVYFAILGALAVPFAILTLRAYRNYREDREDPDWKL